MRLCIFTVILRPHSTLVCRPFSNLHKVARREMKQTHVKYSTRLIRTVVDGSLAVPETLEMSGLDPAVEHILEMACLVTEADLSIVAEAPNLVINQPDAVLDAMDDWCTEHHGKSGLTQSVRDSKISLTEAENVMLSFVAQHTPPGKCPLGGNSIATDREFLHKYMPNFTSHLHYRIIDVSSIKELCRRWYPEKYGQAPPKKLNHRALDDIKESIRELSYYKSSIFIPQDSNK